jgi:hypothetical protein
VEQLWEAETGDKTDVISEIVGSPISEVRGDKKKLQKFRS